MPVREVRKVLRRMRMIQALKLVLCLKRIESAECFRESFLYQVFSLRVIASEPGRVIVERRQERKRKPFEICAAIGGRHFIRCLALDGVTELHRHAEQCFTSGHHSSKPDSRQIIPRIILRGPGIKAGKASFLLQRWSR